MWSRSSGVLVGEHIEPSEVGTPQGELDDWLRRRIRMCYWKQWRWVRTKIKHLLALGVSLQTAIQHRVSSKSWWHMARTPALLAPGVLPRGSALERGVRPHCALRSAHAAQRSRRQVVEFSQHLGNKRLKVLHAIADGLNDKDRNG